MDEAVGLYRVEGLVPGAVQVALVGEGIEVRVRVEVGVVGMAGLVSEVAVLVVMPAEVASTVDTDLTPATAELDVRRVAAAAAAAVD